jgi:WD40 repeat protein
MSATSPGGWRCLLLVAALAGTGRTAAAQQAEPWATLKGHRWVTSLAFSPDGRTLASGDYVGTIKLWEVLTGRERATLVGHTCRVVALAFLYGSTGFGSGSSDESVYLWRPLGNGHPVRRGQNREASEVAFSPNGTLAAAGGGARTLRGMATNPTRYGELRLWGVPRGEKRLTLGGDARLLCLAFAPDGRMLAAGNTDQVVTVWETASGKVRASLREPTTVALAVMFIGDGLLASGNWNGTLTLWDVRRNRVRNLLSGHKERVFGIAATRGGKLLASTSGDKTVRLWDTAAGKQLFALNLDTFAESVAFSPDGKLLAVGDREGTIRLWSVAKLLAHKGMK